MKESHNSIISIAKGIGIVLMVIGHSGCPTYIHNIIYGFHMILFYFLSGFFFRDEKVVHNGVKYLYRKFHGLYWPYIKWSIIFILLHNFFFYVGFNEELLSNKDIWINIKRCILGMWQGEHFLGAYWFLISLFWVIMIFCLIVYLKYFLNYKRFDAILVSVLFCIGIISILYKIDILVNRELMVLPFFFGGVYCR